MIPILIDTSDIEQEFELDQAQIDDLKELTVKRIARKYKAQWRATATRELKQAREEYGNSIRIKYINRFTAAVYLDPTSWISNAIEMGRASYDMKNGFLKSSKVKIGKNGDPYLTIPFRFATPGSLANSPVFNGGVLPSDIHRTAKNKGRNINPSKRSLSLSDIPTQYHIPKSQELRKKVQEISKIPVEDRTSIYEGLQKTKGGYVNFRRVSLRSDSDSWIHPGFKERNFADKAFQEFEPEIGQLVGDSIDDFLDELGF